MFFESMRRCQRLRLWILGLIAALWIVALAGGVPPSERMAGNEQLSSYCGSPDDDFSSSGSGGAHHPECLLCIAVAPPKAQDTSAYRPPQLTLYRLIGDPVAAARGQLSLAPLPARGPPQNLLMS